jgi:DNA-binding transcriptional ArsR family regulator
MARKRSGGRKADGNRWGDRKRKPARKPSRPSEALLNYAHMKAFSKPLRVRILAILAERVASPKEIAQELREGLSQVSYHVAVLRKCDLIAEEYKVPRRGTVEHFYRATAPTIIPPDAWDNLPPSMRKGISMSIMQAFFEDASVSMETGLFDDPSGELSWTPLILDKDGIKQVGRLARDFQEAVLEVQAESSERLARAKGKAPKGVISATVFLASFLSARSPKGGKRAAATKKR